MSRGCTGGISAAHKGLSGFPQGSSGKELLPESGGPGAEQGRSCRVESVPGEDALDEHSLGASLDRSILCTGDSGRDVEVRRRGCAWLLKASSRGSSTPKGQTQPRMAPMA